MCFTVGCSDLKSWEAVSRWFFRSYFSLFFNVKCRLPSLLLGESDFKQHCPCSQIWALWNLIQCCVKFSQSRVNRVWHKYPHLEFKLQAYFWSERDHITFLDVFFRSYSDQSMVSYTHKKESHLKYGWLIKLTALKNLSFLFIYFKRWMPANLCSGYINV